MRESALLERHTVGVDDFVLLEDYTSEEAFIENLRKRHFGGLIYTYIGPVLVSVNPYKELGIYTHAYVERHRNVNFFEVPPHVFAVADGAYRSMLGENRDQCVLISGESGAGKTEASKKVLEFLAATCGHQKHVERVKDRLLQSNPVLEAFGNAKTNRNDNSSRFGKYMDVEFNFKGEPTGGHILNYLLEKSRVVQQAVGERSFHIFYQLLAGAEDQLLDKLQLTRNSQQYNYLKKDGPSLIILKDADDFRKIQRAMDVIEFSGREQEDVFAIVSSVLHMGNVRFQDDSGGVMISDTRDVEIVAKLLGCDKSLLLKALTHRTIDARGDVITTPLSHEQALYARDALAKAVYGRLFSWLVERLNSSLHSMTEGRRTLMGILDIYGFEIFKKNSFEQLCINYCNEKLHQLFIELTLKSEQEEYLKEGIEWETVPYFNNKIICELIEEKHKGIISLLDEECLRPGDPTDLTLLEKLTDALGSHLHFVCHADSNTTRKTIARHEFRVVHYAGNVTYSIHGFLEKNNDLLFRDLKEAMSSSSNSVVQETFPAIEMHSKRLPVTASTQFKESVGQLMNILSSKQPSYIRCIKPNDNKVAGVFDSAIVSHQVKYLGLLENLRVRRAGFAYRREYAKFLERYKCLCPATWPRYLGSPRDGVRELFLHLGYNREEYRLGKSKIFIRLPETLFNIEDAYELKKNDLATLIQKIWKGRQKRKIYLRMREAAIVINAYVRRYNAQRMAARRRWAVSVVRSFIQGFITRNGPITEKNANFVDIVRREYVKRLAKNLPRSVLDRSWPNPPVICQQASELLRPIHRTWQARTYVRKLSVPRKYQLELKVLAEELFKGKKESYKKSVPQLFLDDRLTPEERVLRVSVFEDSTKGPGKMTEYCSAVIKYDRHGYKPRRRAILLTTTAIYLVDSKDFKVKHSLDLEEVKVSLSSMGDSLVLLRIPQYKIDKKDKGDLILELPHVIEFITRLVQVSGNKQILEIADSSSLVHHMRAGKSGTIDISGGQGITGRAKNGHLHMASP